MKMTTELALSSLNTSAVFLRTLARCMRAFGDKSMEMDELASDVEITSDTISVVGEYLAANARYIDPSRLKRYPVPRKYRSGEKEVNHASTGSDDGENRNG